MNAVFRAIVCERQCGGIPASVNLREKKRTKKERVIKLHRGCLPSRNKCTQIFGTLRHRNERKNPSQTHLHTAVLSARSCQSLLGLAFSLARGLDPLSEELNSGPFPPSAFQRAADKKQRRQTGSERQGPLRVSES